ncbi:hypothetical protein PBRA_000088, partial [Plasmodiophora brassicae]
LRSIRLRARHAVALAEWMATLEIVIRRMKQDTKRTPTGLFRAMMPKFPQRPASKEEFRDAFVANLDRVCQAKVDCMSLQEVLSDERTRDLFVEFLSGIKHNDVLDCLAAIYEMKNLAREPTDDKAKQLSERIYAMYLGMSAPRRLDPSLVGELDTAEDDLFHASRLVRALRSQLRKDLDQMRTRASFRAYVQSTIKATAPTLDDGSDPAVLKMSLRIATDGSTSCAMHKLRAKDGSITIGRSSANGICLVDDQNVSRNHARINIHRSSCEIVDLGSTAGTFVNGVRVDLSPIKPGDVIRIGNTTMTVEARPSGRFLSTLTGGTIPSMAMFQ